MQFWIIESRGTRNRKSKTKTASTRAAFVFFRRVANEKGKWWNRGLLFRKHRQTSTHREYRGMEMEKLAASSCAWMTHERHSNTVLESKRSTRDPYIHGHVCHSRDVLWRLSRLVQVRTANGQLMAIFFRSRSLFTLISLLFFEVHLNLISFSLFHSYDFIYLCLYIAIVIAVIWVFVNQLSPIRILIDLRSDQLIFFQLFIF